MPSDIGDDINLRSEWIEVFKRLKMSPVKVVSDSHPTVAFRRPAPVLNGLTIVLNVINGLVTVLNDHQRGGRRALGHRG